MIATEKRSNWITQKDCLELLECSARTLDSLVRAGEIRRRETPAYRRYWRADVERLAAPPPDVA